MEVEEIVGGAPTLSFRLDQGAVGVAGASFLVFRCGLFGAADFDPCHRQWNDCRNALRLTPLWADVVMVTKVLMDFAAGP